MASRAFTHRGKPERSRRLGWVEIGRLIALAWCCLIGGWGGGRWRGQHTMCCRTPSSGRTVRPCAGTWFTTEQPREVWVWWRKISAVRGRTWTVAGKGWFAGQWATVRKGTVFLLHGHNSCKEANAVAGETANRCTGFNSLFYDSRGCGESGGRFCTYGFYETGIVRGVWTSYCVAMATGEIGPVSIYGNSFGGAVALQTMAEDVRFRCGIVESTFATLREVVRDYESSISSGVRMDWLTDRALDPGGMSWHTSTGCRVSGSDGWPDSATGFVGARHGRPEHLHRLREAHFSAAGRRERQ